MPIFYDTHAHLDFPDFGEDLAQAIERAAAAGVDKIISIGTDLESSLRAVKLADQFPGVYGHIRWRKDLGLPSTDSGRKTDPINCGAIRVRAILVTRDSAQERDVGHYGIQDAPKEENGYYVCSYSFTDRGNPNDQLNLPRNRPILVSARFGSFADEALNETLALQPWFGPGNPQPPSGARRALDGSRQIEITDDQPHVNVDFEMVYRATRMRP